MTYQVLARKWRPKVFNDVVGQEHVVTVIKNSFLLNKIHHAYILYGTRGIGKTTIARLFAKILNCKSKLQYDACGICKICSEIEKGCFLDVIEIDAASRTKIEDTREFLDDIYYSPNIGKYKVYLIDEVHMLSRNSLNALLKILEEPPEHVKFLLITTEIKKLPLSVLSRCVQFALRSLSSIQIFKKLLNIFQKERIKFDIDAVKLIANFANGSMRDALSLSEQAIILGKNNLYNDVVRKMLGVLDTEHSLFLLESLINSNINAIMSRIDECEKLYVNWDYLLSDILSLLQKVAVMQISCNKENDINDKEIKFEVSRLFKLSKKVTPLNIQSYYHILLSGRKELLYAPSYRMGFEMIMIRASMLLNFSNNNGFHFSLDQDIEKKDINISDIIVNQGAFTFSSVQDKIHNIIDKKK